MPKYDYQQGNRFANDCSLDGLIMYIVNDLRYNIDGQTEIIIKITKKRGKAKPGN